MISGESIIKSLFKKHQVPMREYIYVHPVFEIVREDKKRERQYHYYDYRYLIFHFSLAAGTTGFLF